MWDVVSQSWLLRGCIEDSDQSVCGEEIWGVQTWTHKDRLKYCQHLNLRPRVLATFSSLLIGLFRLFRPLIGFHCDISILAWHSRCLEHWTFTGFGHWGHWSMSARGSIEIMSGRHIPASIVSYEADSQALWGNNEAEQSNQKWSFRWMVSAGCHCVSVSLSARMIFTELRIESSERSQTGTGARCWSH